VSHAPADDMVVVCDLIHLDEALFF